MATIRNLSELEATPHEVVFPESEPRTVRLELADGERIEPHRHPGRTIVFYLVEGDVELRLDDERYDLGTGDVARFDGDRDISPVARADSTVLIVLAPHTDSTKSDR